MKKDTRPFHFKQFSLYHHQSTMKVGTDAVLLGIWAELNNVKTVLDIGTGSGILSLLIASRAQVSVDAIEMDNASASEAKANFKNVTFSDRLNIVHADFKDYSGQTNKKYDLIISNPPFFINDLRPKEVARRMARHTDSLTYSELISGAVNLLNNSGKLVVVLPYIYHFSFLDIAKKHGLSLHKKMLIFPKPCKEPNRINLQLGFDRKVPTDEKFIIREEDGKLTTQYLKFVSDYYLY